MPSKQPPLTGLFDPPPPPTSSDQDNDQQTTASTTAVDELAATSGDDTINSMAGMMAPMNEINIYDNDNDDTINSMAGIGNNDNTDISTTTTTATTATTATATTPHNTRNLTQLQGLFAPPLAPTSTTTAAAATTTNTNTTTTNTTTTATSSLNSLFAPPPTSTPKKDRESATDDNLLLNRFDRFSTVRTGGYRNAKDDPQETTALLRDALADEGYTMHDLTGDDDDNDDDDEARKSFQDQRDISNGKISPHSSIFSRISELWKRHEHIFAPTTFAGAFMFLLYHVVFCLAMGSAITRPHNLDKPILGIMAKWSTVGIFFSGPLYIVRLGSDIPALYPSIDLFLAPFLAQAAAIVDNTLYEEYGKEYDDAIFFASFAVLVGIGMLLAGTFLLAAASFKLANLGTYLPYSVLCGFFSAVGVLLWALAFSVDTSGKTWQHVFFSGDRELILDSLLHHIPSLCIGILMNRLGPKNPFFVILLIIMTLIAFFTVMAITGTSLEDAQEAKWFWASHELIKEKEDDNTTTTIIDDSNQSTSSFQDIFLPPTPFAPIACLGSSYTHWGAVWNGLENMAALAFLYLLRSSIHASAMKKNVNNLVRRIPIEKHYDDAASSSSAIGEPQNNNDNNNRTSTTTEATTTATSMAAQMVGSMRENVRIVNMSLADKPPAANVMRSRTASEYHDTTRSGGGEIPGVHSSSSRKQRVSIIKDDDGNTTEEYEEIRAEPSKKSLEGIFMEYGYALMVVATTGGFGNCPTVATSNTMFAIGAEKPAPQYGSILLLLIFYFTDFNLVKYIPKAAFSSLLVLGAVDTLVVWFFGAFHKTLELAEWMVVPTIVAFSLVVGFLNAVFLGIGISMFVFVASFFRVGVVKFNATGLELRSRIERSIHQSMWLDEHGDLVQVMVLQNYLFFGNASSILNYISTMFDEDIPSENDGERQDYILPPMPKVLVLDLGLITGMDTSTVDIFAEIKELCKNNNCKLFLCSLSTRLKKGLALGGIKPERGNRAARLVRFFPDLDTALGKAEDFLLESEVLEEPDVYRPTSTGGQQDGFRYALQQIDHLHGQHFAEGLDELAPFIRSIELEEGGRLFQNDGGLIHESERGLFFIESGLLKIERAASETMTMTRTRSYQTLNSTSHLTLRNQHARMGARRKAMEKSTGGTSQNIRVARIGPGWVVGTLENASGYRQAGVVVAMAHCRLHHLPFQKLEELEETHPVLSLKLYKMLSHLMARKDEITTEHLSTLHTIMSSPAHSKPISRSAMKAFGGIGA